MTRLILWAIPFALAAFALVQYLSNFQDKQTISKSVTVKTADSAIMVGILKALEEENLHPRKPQAKPAGPEE